MRLPSAPPPGCTAVPIKGILLVIPEHVFLAALKLGRLLRRRAAVDQWIARATRPQPPGHKIPSRSHDPTMPIPDMAPLQKNLNVRLLAMLGGLC